MLDRIGSHYPGLAIIGHKQQLATLLEFQIPARLVAHRPKIYPTPSRIFPGHKVRHALAAPERLPGYVQHRLVTLAPELYIPFLVFGARSSGNLR